MKMALSQLQQNFSIAQDPQYTILTRLDCAWVLYQFISFFPILFFTLKRFYHQINNEEYLDVCKPLPKSCIEYFMKFNTSMYLVFYIPQTIARFTIEYNSDNVLLIIHHLVTFYGCVSFIVIPYYPWFTLGPLAFHALLLVLPDYIKLYYLYIILIMICYYGLTLPPYSVRKGYKEVNRFLFSLSVVLVIMWATGFRNDIIFEKIEK